MDRMLELERQVELAKHQALLDSMQKDKGSLDLSQPYYRQIGNIVANEYVVVILSLECSDIG